MRTSLKTFWLLNRNIGRIKAEEDLRALNLLLAGQGSSKETIESVRNDLIEEMGEVVKRDPIKNADPLDRVGLSDLKAMTG